MLSIPQDALDTHSLAGVLGSPLECGDRMYKELQDRYSQNDSDYHEMTANDYQELDY